MKSALLIAATIFLTLAVERAGYAAYNMMRTDRAIAALQSDRDQQIQIAADISEQINACKHRFEVLTGSPYRPLPSPVPARK